MARTPLLEIDLHDNGGRTRFYSSEEMRAFVSKEREFWSKVTENDWSAPFNVVSGFLDRLEAAASAPDPWSPDVVSAFGDTVESVFTREDGILHSDTAEAKLVAEVAGQHGLHAARGALAAALYYNPRVNFQNILTANALSFGGVMHYYLGIAGVSTKSARAAARSLAGYAERREEQLGRDREAVDDFFVDHERSLAELENDHRDRRDRLEAAYHDVVAGLGKRAEESIASVISTNAQFREQMHLKAPSEYWDTKAAAHKENARRLRTWLFWVVSLGLVAYIVGFALAFRSLSDFLKEFQGSAAALFVMAGLVAFVAAIPLWFLRILVRFYLSEQHLSQDARERQVMALTYLALSTDAAVAEKDRAIILAALFRSSQDGLVKETAGPDASLAGLISRMLEK